MTASTAAMCRRFAELNIAHWRRAKGLPKSRASARQEALWWIAQMKGRIA